MFAYCIKIYIGECGANILICIKKIKQVKIDISIKSKINKKKIQLQTITCHSLMANKII